MQISFEVKNPRETSAIAKIFASEIIKTGPGRSAIVVGLEGDLGAGKTAFVKSFMRAMGVRQKLMSPTFILMRNFPLRDGCYRRAYHIDAYRTNGKGLKELGVGDALKNPENIVLIEWADRARRILPKDTIFINFKHGRKQNERHITFNRR